MGLALTPVSTPGHACQSSDDQAGARPPARFLKGATGERPGDQRRRRSGLSRRTPGLRGALRAGPSGPRRRGHARHPPPHAFSDHDHARAGRSEVGRRRQRIRGLHHGSRRAHLGPRASGRHPSRRRAIAARYPFRRRPRTRNRLGRADLQADSQRRVGALSFLRHRSHPHGHAVGARPHRTRSDREVRLPLPRLARPTPRSARRIRWRFPRRRACPKPRAAPSPPFPPSWTAWRAELAKGDGGRRDRWNRPVRPGVPCRWIQDSFTAFGTYATNMTPCSSWMRWLRDFVSHPVAFR